MKRIYFVLLVLCSFSFSARADDVLYQCIKNGQTTLQDTKPKDCDSIKKYVYGTYRTQKDEPEGLRPSEMKALQAPSTGPTVPDLTQLYQQSIREDHLDKCYFYKKQIEDALNDLEKITSNQSEIFNRFEKDKSHEADSLRLKIMQAGTNMQYYCSPSTKIISLHDSPYFDNQHFTNPLIQQFYP